jgi:hypothetical protein
VPGNKPQLVRDDDGNIGVAYVATELAFRVNGEAFIESEVVMLILDYREVNVEYQMKPTGCYSGQVALMGQIRTRAENSQNESGQAD